MIKGLQRFMEDNESFIKLLPSEEGIIFMVCDSECNSNDRYKLHNESDFIQQIREILNQY